MAFGASASIMVPALVIHDVNSTSSGNIAFLRLSQLYKGVKCLFVCPLSLIFFFENFNCWVSISG